MAGRKRVYAMPVSKSNRTFKKRKLNRRRRGKRVNNSSSTSKSGRGLTTGFRSRKLSKGRWNNMLWNTTLQKTHYRSVQSFYNTFLTPVASANMTVFSQPALRLGGSFYTTAGGAVVVNVGTPVPTFDGDIILRGGMLKLHMVNDAAGVEPVHVKLFLVKTGRRFLPANIPATVVAAWDPSLIPEFGDNVGRILIQREFQLENAASAEFVHRLKIEKFDTVNYAADINSYYWIVMAGNFAAGGTQNLAVTRSYNLSFSADAV